MEEKKEEILQPETLFEGKESTAVQPVVASNQLVAFEATIKTMAVIADNGPDFIAEIKNKVMKYKGLVFTEENSKELDKTITELNKMVKGIDDKRVSLHKEYEVPYDNFKTVCDNAKSEVLRVLEPLKAQQTEFDKARREQKFTEIGQCYDKALASGNYSKEVLEFIRKIDTEIVIPERYYNVTCTLKIIQQEYDEHFKKIAGDYNVMTTLVAEDDKAEVMAEYLTTKDITGAINTVKARKERIAEQQRQLEERKRQEEEAKAQAETQTVVESQPQPEVAPQPEPMPEPQIQTEPEFQKILVINNLTTSKLSRLVDFLKTNDLHGKIYNSISEVK